ncbi:MAG: ATP-binding protein [Methylococcales bacterium]|nr:ATP-binding protein [Methylococcales bacterium]
MVRNKRFTYQVRPLLSTPQRLSSHTLNKRGRSQTLELLGHLLLNSRQAIVVCGDEGSGKSSLLQALQEQYGAVAPHCLVPGHNTLSYEHILGLASNAIRQQLKVTSQQNLSGELRRLENQHKNLVLMIDDAGLLAPGLINTLIAYSGQNPALKLIFALTHDDLDNKSNADSNLEHCHLIEIPGQPELDDSEFFQDLTANPREDITPDGNHPEQGTTDYLDLPESESVSPNHRALMILIAAVAGLIIIALATQWYSTSKYNTATQVSRTDNN